jgi:hypothetical protein
MPVTDCPSEPSLAESALSDRELEVSAAKSATRSKPLKGLGIAFGITVTVGLALAIWYLSSRIVSGDKGVPSAAPQTAEIPSLTVPSVERYRQNAGLGSKHDAGFALAPESRGFRSQIDPAPIRARLLPQSQLTLRSTGLLGIETVY